MSHVWRMRHSLAIRFSPLTIKRSLFPFISTRVEVRNKGEHHPHVGNFWFSGGEMCP